MKTKITKAWLNDSWETMNNPPDGYCASHLYMGFILSARNGIHLEAPFINGRHISSIIDTIQTCVEGGIGDYPGDKVCSIWRAVRRIHTDLPEECISHADKTLILLHHTFFDRIFPPLIPDSPILKLALRINRRENLATRLTHVVAVILLIAEVPMRILANIFIYCGLGIYGFVDRDVAEYYRFRLLINTNSPASYAFRSIFIASPRE